MMDTQRTFTDEIQGLVEMGVSDITDLNDLEVNDLLSKLIEEEYDDAKLDFLIYSNNTVGLDHYIQCILKNHKPKYRFDREYLTENLTKEIEKSAYVYYKPTIQEAIQEAIEQNFEKEMEELASSKNITNPEVYNTVADRVWGRRHK